jgi:hypothetical protein
MKNWQEIKMSFILGEEGCTSLVELTFFLHKGNNEIMDYDFYEIINFRIETFTY